VDAEQIRSEMRVTRASIDRKLDAIADRTAEARHAAGRRAAAALGTAVTALVAMWCWQAVRSRRRRPMPDYLSS